MFLMFFCVILCPICPSRPHSTVNRSLSSQLGWCCLQIAFNLDRMDSVVWAQEVFYRWMDWRWVLASSNKTYFVVFDQWVTPLLLLLWILFCLSVTMSKQRRCFYFYFFCCLFWLISYCHDDFLHPCLELVFTLTLWSWECRRLVINSCSPCDSWTHFIV